MTIETNLNAGPDLVALVVRPPDLPADWERMAELIRASHASDVVDRKSG